MPLFDYNNDFRVPFRNFVISDLEINDLIGNRFYGAQLATLDLNGSSFPIAVFYPEAGRNMHFGIVKRFQLVIRCYSNNHFDEAYQVYKAVSEKIGGSVGDAVINSNIVIRATSTPTETYESEPRIYGVGGRFLVHWKG